MDTNPNKSIADIANNLVMFCEKGNWQGAYNELYDENAKSVEPYKSPIAEIESIGLKAIKDKANRFDALIEKVFSITVSAPVVIDHYISFSLSMDAVMTGRGRGVILSEICVYRVWQGKIVLEQFFYN